MHLPRVLFAILALIVSGSGAGAQSGERLVYEIVLTAAGSRSQGWHGTLFGTDGKPMQVAPGGRVTTDIGELVSVERQIGRQWRPFGMLPVTPGMRNDIADAAWTYRMYAVGEGTACVSWRGALLRNGMALGPQAAAAAATPWGPFVWRERHGWAHRSWPVRTVACR